MWNLGRCIENIFKSAFNFAYIVFPLNTTDTIVFIHAERKWMDYQSKLKVPKSSFDNPISKLYFTGRKFLISESDFVTVIISVAARNPSKRIWKV